MATDTGTNASLVNEPPDAKAGVPEAQPGGPQAEESRRLCAYWKDQLDQVRDEYRKFEKRGRMIEKRYRDERNRVDEEGQRRYNSLWSNVQVLLPALYGRTPQPVAERRFLDKDPVGRGAAQILQRALQNEIGINGFHEAIELAVSDYLLPGRGVVWVRYEPEIQESVSIPAEDEMEMRDARGPIEPEDDSDAEEKLRDTGDRIVRESVPIDYVPWSDFFTFPAKARVWKEVVAVGKRAYLTREQMERRFGPAGKKVPLEKDDRERRRQNESVVPDEDSERKAQVYEVWSRTDERVYWFAEGYDYLLDRVDDPMKFDEFFPVPRPLFANPTTNTLIPVPDYIQYQDQAIQIDELTQRISQLSKACKVAGVYNAQAKDIQRLLDESVENELIPVDNWAVFGGEKGGVAGQMSLLPLKEIMGVLNELVAVREKALADEDRLTGITDVMRGTTDARETMGGQRLKSNSAGTRLSKRQADVARFCRDTVRLMAQVMANHFSPKSLVEASGALYEEGLGEVDPEIFQMGAPPAGAAQPPGAAPPGAGPGAVAPSPVPPGPSPQQQPGTNVVPFQRPGAPPQPPGAPPQPGAAPLPVPVPRPQPPMMGGAGAMAQPPQPQLPPEMMAKLQGLKRISDAIGLIRDEQLRGFRVDIEVDSTIFGDAAQEKQDRTEFLTAISGFMEKALQMGQMVPESAPLMGKFLQFGVRGFRVGRDLESAIEDFCDKAGEMATKAAQARATQPNPEQLKLQADTMKAQSGLQQTKMKIQGDQVQAAAEVQRQQVENQGEAQNAQVEMANKQAELRMRELELRIEEIRAQTELAKAHQAHQEAMMPKVPAGIA